MAGDLNNPNFATAPDWPTIFGQVRENFRATWQGDDFIFSNAFGIAMRFRAPAAAVNASAEVLAGSGTASTRMAYFRAASLETSAQDWRFGMYGAKDWSLQNFTRGTVPALFHSDSDRLDLVSTDGALAFGTASTPRGNLQSITGDVYLSSNARYDVTGAAWNRINTGALAWNVGLISSLDLLRIQRASAGANPIAWTNLLTMDSAGNTDFTSSIASLPVVVQLLSTANNNDVAIGSGGGVRFSIPVVGNPQVVTGIAGGRDGRVLFIYNQSNFNITFNFNDVGSAAGNRIWNRTGAAVVLTNGGGALLWYNANVSKWIMVSP